MVILDTFVRKFKNFLEINKYASNFFDLIASTRLYKWFVYKKIKSYTSKIKKNKMYNIIIETSNLCNARCVMCPYVIMKRKREIMKDNVFNKIIFKLKKEKINPLAFILNGFGDPLTDKKIFERIKLLKKEFPNSVIKFYTNLGLADKKIISKILTSGLDEINISLNGYNKNNYEKTMGINYEKTLKNLNELINRRNKINSKLKIRLSMALVSYNDGTEKKFINRWQKKVDSVSINKVHNYGDSVENPSGINKINYNKLTYPCKYLWNTLVFSVKGNLLMCCLDYEANYSFGNIKNNKILDMFYSKKFNNLRELHLKNNIKNIPLCNKCYTPYKNGVEWFFNELY